ncbi:hypothetical protein MAR_025313, partial [Mya arenaria]
MDALNHSDRSDMFQDHELIEAVLQKPEDGARLNDSAGSRLSSIFVPQHSLRSTGNLSRPVSIVSNSKRSIALSQEKLSDVVEPLVEEKVDLLRFEHLKFHVYVLALFCVCSLVLGSLSIQLTLALASHHTSTRDRRTVIDANLTYDTVTEVATALSTFVVTLDITCLLVCSLQCLVVVKLLKVSLGEERAAKFLRDCSSSRFIAVTGFFVSIPAFLV